MMFNAAAKPKQTAKPPLRSSRSRVAVVLISISCSRPKFVALQRWFAVTVVIAIWFSLNTRAVASELPPADAATNQLTSQSNASAGARSDTSTGGGQLEDLGPVPNHILDAFSTTEGGLH